MLGCHFENHYRISKLLNAGCEQSNQGEVTASPDSAILNIFENFNKTEKTENWPDLMSGGVCFYDIPSSSELFLWRECTGSRSEKNLVSKWFLWNFQPRVRLPTCTLAWWRYLWTRVWGWHPAWSDHLGTLHRAAPQSFPAVQTRRRWELKVNKIYIIYFCIKLILYSSMTHINM